MSIFKFDIFTKVLRKIRPLIAICLVFALTACGEDDPCPTIQEYKNNGIGDNCLLCKLFDIITKAGASAANTSWSALPSGLIPLVAVAGAIYIAIYTLKMAGSFGKQNAADYMTGDKKGLLLLMFKVAVVILLLKEKFFIDSILIPILQGGLEIGSVVAVPGTTISYATDAGGWDALFDMINAATKQFNDTVYQTVAIGEAMICNATRPGILSWEWLLLLYGFIFYIAGWILLTGISFYMVDLLIRLVFGAVLLPVGIACYVSNQTVGYTKNIWNIFLNVFFSFIMLGIVLGLSVQLVELSMGVDRSAAAAEAASDAVGASGGALHLFMHDFNALIDMDQIKEIAKELLDGGSILLTLVCFYLVTQLSEQMGKLAESISDTAGITSAASQTGAAAGKIASKQVKKVGAQAGQYAGHATTRILRDNALSRWGGKKINAARGFLTGTGSQGYNAFWHKQTWKKKS